MSGLIFFVVLVAFVLAAVFAMQARSAAAALKGLTASTEAAKKEAEAERARAKQLDTELKARSQLLQETREKLADARRKGSQEPRAKPVARGVREAELEEDLAHARSLTEQAHASEQHARKEAAAAKAEAARAEAELPRLQEKVRELTAQLAAAPRPGTAVTTIPSPTAAQDDAAKKELEAAKKELESTRRELTARAEAIDAQLRQERQKLLEAREEMKKARGRAETNNRVFLVTKGELDMVKERLAQAERRLWQAGITLPKPEEKERPKAKGPAAAERVAAEKAARAGSAQGAPGEASAAATAQPGAEGEAQQAGAEQGGGSQGGAEQGGGSQGVEGGAQAPAQGGAEGAGASAASEPSAELLERIGPRRRRPADANGNKPGDSR